PVLHSFLLHRYAPHPPLPSFPTRRSSDLASLAWASDSAITTATRSPTCRTLPCASGGYGGSFIGWPLTSVISQPQGSPPTFAARSEEHTSELQSRFDLVCRLLLEKKKINP